MLGLREIIRRWRAKPRPPQLPDRVEIHSCCKQKSNLKLSVQRVQQQHDGSGVPIEVWVCAVCLRKHHVMKVGEKLEPGKFKIGA